MSLINPPNINNSGNGYYSKINKFLKLSKLNVKTSRVLLIIAIICVLFFITTHLFRTKQQQNIIDQEPITSTTTPLKSKNSSQKTQSTTGTNTLADSVAQQRTFTIWSTSFHISPIQCLSHFLQNSLSKKTGLKIKIINKSLSGHCHLQNSCARNLQVLNQDTAQKSLCNSHVGSDLFNAYRRDEEFSSVDLIMCDHNIAMCELYMPFDKPMVLYATTRYELWRHDVFSWKKLNQNLERISQKAHNSLIANNEFDANYVNYFTGLKVPVLDSFCAYPADEGTYQPIKKEFLVGPSRLNLPHHFFTKFNEAVAKDESRKENPVKIVGIRELYKNYKYSDLASHPAIVIVPYQLSVMSFFEYYRMNIPMYAPSVELITEWERDYDILKEKTWGHVLYGGKSTGSPKELSQHPKSTTKLGLDPNNEVDRETTMYWNGFADFYQWPNIIIYTSWEDLYQKLRDTPKEKYLEISEKMKQYNKKVENDLIEKWTDIIERALKHEKRNEMTSKSYEQVMKERWNINTTTECTQ